MGAYVGVIGHVLYFPRKGERRGYYWIVAVDTAGKVAWQKLIPLVSPVLSLSTDFTSAQLTPRQNLLFSRFWLDTTELVSVDLTGQLVASRQLKGYFVVVSSPGNRAIQVFGGDLEANKSLISLDENLQETQREDNLPIPNFLVANAYSLSGPSLLLMGSDLRGNRNYSAIHHLTKQRSVESTRLIHDDLFDAGKITASAPMSRSGEFIVVRNLLKGQSDQIDNLGIALSIIRTSSK
jgi:hypothetical protein